MSAINRTPDDLDQVARFIAAVFFGVVAGGVYGGTLISLGASWVMLVISPFCALLLVILQQFSAVRKIWQRIEAKTSRGALANLLINLVAPVGVVCFFALLFLEAGSFTGSYAYVFFTIPVVISVVFTPLSGVFISTIASFLLVWFFAIPPDDSFAVESISVAFDVLMTGAAFGAFFYAVTLQRSITPK
jgi:K+-sensing histidine kinase KdpD